LTKIYYFIFYIYETRKYIRIAFDGKLFYDADVLQRFFASKEETVGSQSSYQYSSGPSGPYQSPQQFQGGQYGGQGGYQQGYQQYPPPSDPNYANYQNWQYGQGGPQAYGPYNQWGSYNYY